MKGSQPVTDTPKSTAGAPNASSKTVWVRTRSCGNNPAHPDTAIAALQCWSLTSGRMAIVTIYHDGNGFDPYVNTLLQSLDDTVEVIWRLGEVEDAIDK